MSVDRRNFLKLISAGTAGVGAASLSLAARAAEIGLILEVVPADRLLVTESGIATAAEQQSAASEEINRSIEQDKFLLYYQPIVHLGDESLLGYEALIRWQHPTRGLLPPGAFLQAADSTNDHDLGLFQVGAAAGARGHAHRGRALGEGVQGLPVQGAGEAARGDHRLGACQRAPLLLHLWHRLRCARSRPCPARRA